MNKSKNHSPKWTRQRIGTVVVIVVLALVYIFAQPTLEKWLGVQLPSLIEQNQAENNDSQSGNGSTTGNDASATGDSSSTFQLTEIRRDIWKSPEGLVYTMGPRREHRIDHVLLHSQDDSARDVHGVFEPGDRDSVLALLDQAYAMVKRNAREVQSENSGDRTELTIVMPNTIGYVGGQSGKRDNFPKTSTLKMILEHDRVVTAYPVKSRR